jgi:chromosome segregation ATPase
MSTVTEPSSEQLAKHIAACETELSETRAQLPAAQRESAKTFLAGGATGEDAVEPLRRKVARLQDRRDGLRQLHAAAEHVELSAKLSDLRHQHREHAEICERLRQRADRPRESIPGTGSALRRAERARDEALQADYYKYEFAVKMQRNRQQEIAQLESRLEVLAAEFPDAVDAVA